MPSHNDVEKWYNKVTLAMPAEYDPFRSVDLAWAYQRLWKQAELDGSDEAMEKQVQEILRKLMT